MGLIEIALVLGLGLTAFLYVNKHHGLSGELADALKSIQETLKGGLGSSLLLVAGAIVLLVIVAANPPAGVLLTAIALAVLWFRWWAIEFSFLMGLRDVDFPGRYDKPIWAAMLVFLGPVGLWMFREYRTSRWPASETSEAKQPAGASAESY